MKIKAAETTYVKETRAQKKAEIKARKRAEKTAKKACSKDILHDTPLRYAGYCDDIGAATKVICSNSKNALIKNLPVISYIPVGAYIGADVLSTYNKVKKEEGKEEAKKQALSQGVFQGITSILFPIGIVGAAQKGAGKLFDSFIPALRQNFTENGAKIINRKRDVALALFGIGALLTVSKYADKFAKNVLMEKIINPIIGIKEKKAEDVKTPEVEPLIETSKETPKELSKKAEEHIFCTTQG